MADEQNSVCINSGRLPPSGGVHPTPLWLLGLVWAQQLHYSIPTGYCNSNSNSRRTRPNVGRCYGYSSRVVTSCVKSEVRKNFPLFAGENFFEHRLRLPSKQQEANPKRRSDCEQVRVVLRTPTAVIVGVLGKIHATYGPGNVV